MPSYLIQTPDGTRAIVCVRGSQKRIGPCVVCRVPGQFLCDYPAVPRGRVKTCDNALCEKHTTRLGANRDLCPDCARAAGEEVLMKLDEIVARQYQNARRNPGKIAREVLPQGLVANLKLVGDEWHLQFLRIGRAPQVDSEAHKKWLDEIHTCRKYWNIPPNIQGEPRNRPDNGMYAMNFVFAAVAQPQLV